MKIPLPTIEQPDIFSYGFSPTLNRTIDKISTGPVYDPIGESSAPGKIYAGSQIPISTIIAGSGGVIEIISANRRFFYQNITKRGLTNSAGNDTFRVDIDTKAGVSNDTNGGTIEWTLLAKDTAQLQSRTGITTWAGPFREFECGLKSSYL